MKAVVAIVASTYLVACTPSKLQQGCEVTCRMLVDCAFGAPDQVPNCTASCVDQLGSASEACQNATAELGTCGEARTCTDFAAGACHDQTDRATAACQGGGELPDAGAGGDAPMSADAQIALAADRTTITTELYRTETVTITVTATGGFAGWVDLTRHLTATNGAATDWTLAGPAYVTVPANGTATATYTLTIPSDARTLAGTLEIDAAAVAGTRALRGAAMTSVTAAKQISIHFPAGTGAGSHAAIGPAQVAIRPGTQLVFWNDDAIPHVIHGNGGILHELSTGGQPGGAYIVTPESSGDWYCHTHEGSAAARTVTVEAP